MTKGKQQDTEPSSGDIRLRRSTLMSDDGYAQLGSPLKQGERPPSGREQVFVNPRPPLTCRLRIVSTPLGMMAPPLMATFGVDEALIDLFLQGAQPRCSRCHEVAQRSDSLDPNRWPSDGYVAIVVDGIEAQFPLEEQCELLDAERAVIDGHLVRREDIAGREGEPVLNLQAASQFSQIAREVELWLSRGGAPIRLMHYPSRHEAGSEIQKLFKEWRCARCGEAYPIASRQRIEDAPPCTRCRGEGWLLVENDRFLACEDCDAFGRVSDVAHYEVAGTLLKDVSQLSFQGVRDYLRETPVAGMSELAARVECICEEGFALYPIASPVDYLSKGERVVATIASARLSAISEVDLVVDGGAIGAPGSWCASLSERNHLPSLKLVRPTNSVCERLSPALEEGGILTLRDVEIGPFGIPSISFAVGELSTVQGAPGTGKSLLLAEIARRFSKRKKLAHLASFGALKRCSHLEAERDGEGTVMDLLGIASLVAEQAARSRRARELGLLKDDFIRAGSKHRCASCGGVPALDEERCGVCDGALFDRAVGEVVVNDLAFADLLRGPLTCASAALWADDELSVVFGHLPEELKSSVSLSTPARALSPAVRRFLSIVGPLARILAGPNSLKGELVLIDVPFGTTAPYQDIVIQRIKDLRARGGTIVCAGVPEALENLFSSVVRLRLIPRPTSEERTRRFLDIRMTPKSECIVDRQGEM